MKGYRGQVPNKGAFVLVELGARHVDAFWFPKPGSSEKQGAGERDTLPRGFCEGFIAELNPWPFSDPASSPRPWEDPKVSLT